MVYEEKSMMIIR